MRAGSGSRSRRCCRRPLAGPDRRRTNGAAGRRLCRKRRRRRRGPLLFDAQPERRRDDAPRRRRFGRGGFDAHFLWRLLGDGGSGLFNRRGGFGDHLDRRRLRRFRRHLRGWFLDDRFGLRRLRYGRRHRGGLHRLHQARRWQHRRRRLRRLGRFLGRRRFLAFGCRRVGEYVAALAARCCAAARGARRIAAPRPPRSCSTRSSPRCRDRV